LPARCALAVVAFAVVYLARQTVAIWNERRRGALAIYYTKDTWALYAEETTRNLYFHFNPMPIWSLVDRALVRFA